MARMLSSITVLAILILAGCGGGPAVQPAADQGAPEAIAADTAAETTAPSPDMEAPTAEEIAKDNDADAVAAADEAADETVAEEEAAAIEEAPAVQVIEPVMVNMAQITLQNGMKVRGLIRIQTNKEVTIETAFGKATFPAKRVVKIEYIQVPVGGSPAGLKGSASGG